MSDYMVRATAADGQIRAFAITSKEMTEEAREGKEHFPSVSVLFKGREALIPRTFLFFISWGDGSAPRRRKASLPKNLTGLM